MAEDKIVTENIIDQDDNHREVKSSHIECKPEFIQKNVHKMVSNLYDICDLLHISYSLALDSPDLELEIRNVLSDILGIYNNIVTLFSKFETACKICLDDMPSSYDYLVDCLEDQAKENLENIKMQSERMIEATKTDHETLKATKITAKRLTENVTSAMKKANDLFDKQNNDLKEDLQKQTKEISDIISEKYRKELQLKQEIETLKVQLENEYKIKNELEEKKAEDLKSLSESLEEAKNKYETYKHKRNLFRDEDTTVTFKVLDNFWNTLDENNPMLVKYNEELKRMQNENEKCKKMERKYEEEYKAEVAKSKAEFDATMQKIEEEYQKSIQRLNKDDSIQLPEVNEQVDCVSSEAPLATHSYQVAKKSLESLDVSREQITAETDTFSNADENSLVSDNSSIISDDDQWCCFCCFCRYQHRKSHKKKAKKDKHSQNSKDKRPSQVSTVQTNRNGSFSRLVLSKNSKIKPTVSVTRENDSNSNFQKNTQGVPDIYDTDLQECNDDQSHWQQKCTEQNDSNDHHFDQKSQDKMTECSNIVPSNIKEKQDEIEKLKRTEEEEAMQKHKCNVEAAKTKKEVRMQENAHKKDPYYNATNELNQKTGLTQFILSRSMAGTSNSEDKQTGELQTAFDEFEIESRLYEEKYRECEIKREETLKETKSKVAEIDGKIEGLKNKITRNKELLEREQIDRESHEIKLHFREIYSSPDHGSNYNKSLTCLENANQKLEELDSNFNELLLSLKEVNEYCVEVIDHSFDSQIQNVQKHSEAIRKSVWKSKNFKQISLTFFKQWKNLQTACCEIGEDLRRMQSKISKYTCNKLATEEVDKLMEKIIPNFRMFVV